MHNTVDTVNRYLATTTGREKLCRLVQYFSRFYVFHLVRQGAPKEVVLRWNNLKTHIGNGRKFFRLLKNIEFAQTGIKNLSMQGDNFLRVCAVVKQFAMCLYYSSEAFVLVNAIQFYKLDQPKKFTEFGQKCWFIGIAASILSGLRKLQKLSEAANTDSEKNSIEKTKKIQKVKHDATYQLVQDCFDILIPSTGLGWLALDEGAVGIAGMITSAMAMKTQWKKVAQ